MNANEVRNIASQYAQDLPVKFRDGIELWGTATGGIPYHRKWWLLDGDRVLGFLDQGCYDNARRAKKARMNWACRLGVVAEVCVHRDGDYKFLPLAETGWAR